ncbi:organic hydroperoxide resistance protein [Gordonia zhaorongruii]|uniref:organic hydroperoxide resistance protein n=1 Tax=Gordonia zhaorongruii TaxID=2597659 RepID=UPI00104FA202|nr:organic hydroperoxide resistance protein [Gordonia zhaorongruii]
MTVTPVYRVSSTSRGGGRDGEVVSETGRIDLTLAPPTEMGGKGDGSNPEELFSAGWAACFMGALRNVAKKQGATVPEGSEVKVTVGIGKDDTDDGFGLTADIDVYLPGLETSQANELALAGHGFCPYSKATRGNVVSTVTSRV